MSLAAGMEGKELFPPRMYLRTFGILTGYDCPEGGETLLFIDYEG